MKKTLLLFTLLVALIPTLLAQPTEFNFTPNNNSAGVIATVQVNGFPATRSDWIAVFDEDNNCAGAVQLISYGGQAFCNLQVYGNDPTTSEDDGIDAEGETFTFKLWEAATNKILDHPVDIEPVACCNWGLSGSPVPGFGFADGVILNFLGEGPPPIDDDGDGYFGLADPDDTDPCNPNNRVAACDTDGDGIPDGSDPHPNCNGKLDQCGVCNGTGIEIGTCDCNGTLPSTWYADNDFDCLGDPNNSTESCVQPVGFVDNANDEDDTISDNNASVCDADGDGVSDLDDPDDNDPCNPNLSAEVCDADGDGYPIIEDPNDNNPCIPNNNTLACDLSTLPAEFYFIPNNTARGITAIVEINGSPASDLDWIAAFDEDGNCAGAVQLIAFNNQIFANLKVYGDDPTTDNIDEGINDGETFTLKIWVAATNEILDNPIGVGPISSWNIGIGFAILGYLYGDQAVLNFVSSSTDSDGDGFIVGVDDPDDNDPCNPDNNAETCDNDGDGISGAYDPDDTDPCNPNSTLSVCDVDGDEVSYPDDPDDNDPCNPYLSAEACDGDRDGYPATDDPNDNNPCIPNNNLSACDTDDDGIIDAVDALTPPSEFYFRPNDKSAGIIAIVEINGMPASGLDWIAAFDENGNCAGAVQLIPYGGLTFCNLQVYGDDYTTPNIDEGINEGETFTFKLWVAATNQLLDHPADIVPVTGWSAGLDGETISGYDFIDNAALNFVGNVGEINIGCTDIAACNYNSNVTIDDGSCFYSEPNFQCGDCNAGGIDEDLLTNGLTVCENSLITLCTNGLENLAQACNGGEYGYYWRVYVKTGNLFSSWVEVSGWIELGPCPTIPVTDLFIDKEGQLPPLYTAGATIVPERDDKPLSLLIEAAAICVNENRDIIDGCLAENGPDFLSFVNSSTRRTVIEVTYYLTGNENCTVNTTGCTDANACNYNALAIIEDDSCAGVGDSCDDNDDTTIEDTYNENCECTGTTIPGCISQLACNYNPNATLNDGLCIFPEAGYDCFGNCLIDCAGTCGGTTLAGLPCDDGNPFSINDVYRNDCFCAGYIPLNGPVLVSNHTLSLNITDNCNCIFGIDLNDDNIYDLSRRTYTIKGNRPPFTVSNSSDNFYDSSGNILDNTALTNLIIGSILDVWIYADNDSRVHSITITDSSGRDISTTDSSLCRICPENNAVDCTPPSVGSFNCE